MQTISAVKFATLHNDKTIFYSHIDCLHQVFDKINSLNREVILITGSGDISVNSFNAPPNVKYWFAQNCLVQNEKIIPIPIGLRNSFPHYFIDQCDILSGCDYYFGKISEDILIDIYLNNNSFAEKFLYANFNVNSNLVYRSFLRDICKEIDFINYEEPIETDFGYNNYYSKILDHQLNFCPAGNGIDTHRIWETLYCKRIPITINCNSYCRDNKVSVGSAYIPPQENEYAIYTKLYSKLPIIILDSYEELFDKSHLQKLIDNKREQEYDLNILDFNYWKNIIFDLEKTLK